MCSYRRFTLGQWFYDLFAGSCSYILATNACSPEDFSKVRVVAIQKAIHDYGKHGGMYIIPGCIANVNRKLLNKDHTRSPNDEKF